MSKPSSGNIDELSQAEALKQSLKATRRLIIEFDKITREETEQDTAKLEKLTAIREQLIYQVFSKDWSEKQVQQHLTELKQLEQLDQQLRDLGQILRDQLHNQRSANQLNRKAVNAYGSAKGQFQR
ncbi:hypothetical protein [Marinospirillum perlucidum]|uniref:hypothetical protein n=1 Tax=Marinospirillum perlucidum TaxID=1982602 RepID=UPI000DF451A3|nr:hypothetical protein [Marinospirillum perlucidum]